MTRLLRRHAIDLFTLGPATGAAVGALVMFLIGGRP